jgi:hypothetical protein
MLRGTDDKKATEQLTSALRWDLKPGRRERDNGAVAPLEATAYAGENVRCFL